MIPIFLSTVVGRSFRFVNPWLFLLLLVIPLIWFLKHRKSLGATIRFSSLNNLKNIRRSNKAIAAARLPLILYLALALFVVALARPQSGITREKMTTEGVDIAISLDISSSMQSVDFKPQDRLGAAKKVAREFIEGRENDRLALIIFAAHAFTQCPLTVDYGMLINFLDQIEIGQIEDGTAIGLGLATAVSRLADSKSKSKVVILLTDGVNNRGEIDPITAARMAQALGIRVYTIGMGKPGGGLIPINDPIFGRRYQKANFELDEGVLRNIAQITGGSYFRATDTDKLAAIFQEIDEMEKTRIEISQFTKYREIAPGLIILGFILLFLFIFLGNTIYRKLP